MSIAVPDPSAPVGLRLSLDIGVCAEVCVPEHFDVATELGTEAAGRRANFGASPGDEGHPEPYLYVTHWADVADDPYWNDTTFSGASLAYAAVAAASDPEGTVRAFFDAGRAALAGGSASS